MRKRLTQSDSVWDTPSSDGLTDCNLMVALAILVSFLLILAMCGAMIILDRIFPGDPSS